MYNENFRKFMTLVTIWCFMSFKAFGDDLTPKVTSLKQGQSAPFDGVLLNTAAAAKVFVTKDFSDEECSLKIGFEVEKEQKRIQEQLDKLQASREFEEKRYEIVISQKDSENKALMAEIMKADEDYSIYWFAGGVLSGMAVTIGIGYAVSELSK